MADQPIAPAKDSSVVSLPVGDQTARLRTVFVRDYETMAAIGVYDSELNRKQKIRLNIELTVHDGPGPLADQLSDVVCYDSLIQAVETYLGSGHIGLVETLAEAIADLALSDARVRRARIRVEKLEAIKSAASVGVEIERQQKDLNR